MLLEAERRPRSSSQGPDRQWGVRGRAAGAGVHLSGAERDVVDVLRTHQAVGQILLWISYCSDDAASVQVRLAPCHSCPVPRGNLWPASRFLGGFRHLLIVLNEVLFVTFTDV